MSFVLEEEQFWKNDACYIIAEVGNNHNGSIKRAKQMVDDAVELGVDCVKFQMRQMKKVYREKTLNKSGDDLSAEYTIDLLNKFELSLAEQKDLFHYCKQKGVTYLCTPWDEDSVDFLVDFGVEAFKVASADLTNIPLLKKLCSTKKFLILSTGMARDHEIEQVVTFLNQQQAKFCLLHCNSTYPAPFHGINLRYLEKLKKIHSKVGYSGHERGIAVSLAAVGFGAKVVERHFTLDREMEGPDHAASLEKDDFKQLVIGIRQLEKALGHGGKRVPSQGEMMNRENLSKSLVAAKNLKKGSKITENDVIVRSPGMGLSPLFYESLVGQVLKRDMASEDYFFRSDIAGEITDSRKYNFKQAYGIPLRYHDFKFFYDKLKGADLVEFHLSYADMDLKISDFLQGTYPIDFVVHAPELFKGSHLMDLSSDDPEYLKYSMQETQRTIDITRELKQYFPMTKNPLIVCNMGGFSRDGNISESKKKELYDKIATNMKKLDTAGVELIPQTMAPFPWHFGGQRYQNLFVFPHEVANFCKEHNVRMCVDVSHTCLAANHFGFDLYKGLEIMAPYTAHMHLGDGQGVDGEGLQVDEGEIDFSKLGKVLNNYCEHASFIPEIWQGHKNGGEGFWIALEKLESYFNK